MGDKYYLRIERLLVQCPRKIRGTLRTHQGPLQTEYGTHLS